MLADHFPPKFEPRQVQRDILADIEQCLDSGYKHIILCAPTGVGKSLVGVTVARHFGAAYVVTASKNLQRQYVRDIGFLKPVMGKSNFECHKTMADKRMDDPKYALHNGMTCEKGQCVVQRIVDGKSKNETCKFKPTIADIQDKKFDDKTCKYYLQKYQGLLSAYSLWNYSSFFQVVKFGMRAFEPYLGKPLAIFDEAHTLEDQIVQFVGYDIRQRQIEEAGIDLGRYNLGDVSDAVSIITEIAKHYSEKIHDVESSADPESHPEFGVLARLKSIYDEAAQARADISSDMGNFVVNRPETDPDGQIRSISVKPIDVSEYVGDLFIAENNMFMSATIDKPSFCESMGFDRDDVAIVDTPKSPFPAENRAVEMLRVRHLNYRSTPEDERAIVDVIDQIMNQHHDKRGLILTSSVSKCYMILNALSERNRNRVRICHSSNPGGRTQGEIIAEHASDPTGVLLSSSLWEGVDLKDDLSRFQVIAKVPYPNYAEGRTQAKMRMFPRWYTARTLTKLLQGLGRSVRSDTDWARTYILDAAADRLLRSRDMIPRSYHDVLRLDGSSSSSSNRIRN